MVCVGWLAVQPFGVYAYPSQWLVKVAVWSLQITTTAAEDIHVFS